MFFRHARLPLELVVIERDQLELNKKYEFLAGIQTSIAAGIFKCDHIHTFVETGIISTEWSLIF